MALAAAASPSPVNGTTTNLGALGAYAGGESNLTYTWTDTAQPPGATDPIYSANGSNAAQETTATFYQAGNYTFQVTISDGSQSTTSSVNVAVNQTLTSITVAPAGVTLNEYQTQPFTATALDQLGNSLASQPAFTWSLASGVGSVNATGLYTAPAATGSAIVNAASGAVSGTGAVTVIHAAPVLSGSNNLAAINENETSSNGTLVSDLIAGKVTDANPGESFGIAVTAVDNTSGTWQYSTNGGSTWTAFGTPSPTTARLLAADAGTRVRFVPNADWFGTVAGGVVFRAWDQTSGTAGGTADVTANGGTTAFSLATAGAAITVNQVTQPPVLVPPGRRRPATRSRSPPRGETGSRSTTSIRGVSRWRSASPPRAATSPWAARPDCSSSPAPAAMIRPSPSRAAWPTCKRRWRG